MKSNLTLKKRTHLPSWLNVTVFSAVMLFVWSCVDTDLMDDPINPAWFDNWPITPVWWHPILYFGFILLWVAFDVDLFRRIVTPKMIVASGLVVFMARTGSVLVIYGLILYVLWWLFVRKGNMQMPELGVHATSRWANDDDLKEYIHWGGDTDGRDLFFAQDAAGKLLGMRPGAGGRVEPGHAAFIGPTRSGKSVAAYNNLMQWNGSAFVMDPKGELYQRTGGYRKKLGQRVLVISTRGEVASEGARIDPVQLLSFSEDGLRQLAYIMLKVESDPNPIFAKRGSLLLMAAFRGSIVKRRPGLPFLKGLFDAGHLNMIRLLYSFNDAKVNSYLQLYLGDHNPASVTAEDLRNDRFLSSSFSTMVTDIAPLMSEKLLTMFGGHDVDAASIMRTPTTIYFIMPLSEMVALTPAIQVVVVSLMQALMHACERNQRQMDKTLLWILDEIAQVPVPKLPELMSTVAGFNMTMHLFLQDVSQLGDPKKYGQAGAKTILANCRTQVYHSPDDAVTAELVSKRTGRIDHHEFVFSESVSSKKIFERPTLTRGVSVSRNERELLTAAEFQNQMGADEVVAFTRGVLPIRGKRLMPNSFPWASDPQNEGWKLKKAKYKPIRFNLKVEEQAPKKERRRGRSAQDIQDDIDDLEDQLRDLD